jgi:hypothetical protein
MVLSVLSNLLFGYKEYTKNHEAHNGKDTDADIFIYIARSDQRHHKPMIFETLLSR